jgi:hypothetical protein
VAGTGVGNPRGARRGRRGGGGEAEAGSGKRSVEEEEAWLTCGSFTLVLGLAQTTEGREMCGMRFFQIFHKETICFMFATTKGKKEKEKQPIDQKNEKLTETNPI